MLRALIGLIKGSIVGGAVGYGLLRLGATQPLITYAGCALVGALVGVVCGRAPWRSETVWTPVVKALVGGLIGLGLAALGRRFLPDVAVANFEGMAIHTTGPAFLAAAVGVLYGVFVEIDDGGPTKQLPPAGRPGVKKKA